MSSSKGEHRISNPTTLIICTLTYIIAHIDLSLLGAFLPPRRYIPGACSRAGSIHALAHFLKIFLYKKMEKLPGIKNRGSQVHQSKKKYRRQDNELEERDFQELLEEAKQRLKECHDNALAHYRKKHGPK